MILRRGLLLIAVLSALVSCSGTPSVIRDEWRAAPSGVVTVVFFTDFQCPFCRRTHAALQAATADRPGRVRVVLRHVPLHMHPDADGAARAAICSEGSPRYEDVVNGLYLAPDLGEAANEELVVSLGADREKYRACFVDPATTRRIDHDVSMLDALAGDGVPLLYVGHQRLDGSQTRRDLASAIDAESGAPSAASR